MSISLGTTAAEILRRAMRRRGMTQERLATLTGVAQTTISRILHGADPRLSTARCLAAVVPELLGQCDDELCDDELETNASVSARST